MLIVPKLAPALAMAAWLVLGEAGAEPMPPLPPAGGAEAPDQAPLPSRRPTMGKLLPPGAAVGKLLPPEPKPQPTEGTLVPPEEMRCRARLAALGVAFERRPPVRDGEACAVPHPVWVTRLGAGVELSPGGLMTCPMAEAAARFSRTVAAEAQSRLGKELRSVGQGSAYVCRPRRGSGKMSEHATGNALDIGSFSFADGSSLAVGLGLSGREADFLHALRQAACGPFATVLGPGSDSDHADHLHLDLAERRSGPFCQ